MGKIILGSASPRRADLLQKMNMNFEVIPSDYVEKHDKTVFSYEFVKDLAYNKALCVAKNLAKEGRNELVVGADTIVVVDNNILGKPKDFDEARKMLEILSGREHFVVTAVAIVNSKDLSSVVDADTTYVEFEKLTPEQILNYINDFRPFDKAGAYGLQELPNGYVANVRGEIDTVIGLPTKLLKKMLENFT